MAFKVKKAQEPSLAHSIGVTDINVVETTFKWVVNNFSFYQTGFGNKLNSPVFETTNNKNITWRIDLDPSTSKKFNNLSANLKLVQSSLPKVYVTFEFIIINKDGQPEKSTSSKSATFYKGTSKGSKILMSHGYFQKNAQRILPNDTLTILCKIKANLDQGATNTMKAKAVPKQKSKAQCLPDQGGKVPAAKKAKDGLKQQNQVQAEINYLTEAATKMDIEDLPKPSSETLVGAVASNTLSTNVAANVYPPPMNTAYAYSTPPPSYQPEIASFASTVIEYKSNLGPSASSAAPPPNSSTPSPLSSVPQSYNDYCRYCNYLLCNCTCNFCKYCKFPSQYCKCVRCKICNFRVKECACMCCEYCGDLIEDCDCEYCSYCDYHIEECECDTCEYCGSEMEECDCPYCPDCDLHIEECDCDDNHCTYCNDHLEICECDYCSDCECPNDDCECNEFGNHHFYY